MPKIHKPQQQAPYLNPSKHKPRRTNSSPGHKLHISLFQASVKLSKFLTAINHQFGYTNLIISFGYTNLIISFILFGNTYPAFSGQCYLNSLQLSIITFVMRWELIKRSIARGAETYWGGISKRTSRSSQSIVASVVMGDDVWLWITSCQTYWAVISKRTSLSSQQSMAACTVRVVVLCLSLHGDASATVLLLLVSRGSALGFICVSFLSVSVSIYFPHQFFFSSSVLSHLQSLTIASALFLLVY